MFDYAGCAEDELVRLCDKKKADRGECRGAYWTSETYSMGRCLRDYAGFPATHPLYVYCKHGVTLDPVAHPYEINTDAEAMLVFNGEQAARYRAASKTPCHVVAMPYVAYRRKRGIEPASDARGALVFPMHSTERTDVLLDFDHYVDQLIALPKEFHPVCVCLYMTDIHKGLHRHFMRRGIPVYTAGAAMDVRFCDRFYDILRRFKYTLSNHVGSYTAYSIEMGIPFSLYGNIGLLRYNEEAHGQKKGICDLHDNEYERLARELIGDELHLEITPNQKEYADRALGVGQGVSGEELNRILWDAYRTRKRHWGAKDLYCRARRKVKKRLGMNVE